MVIQRWQSVLLFIAALCMGCFTFMSLGQMQLPDYSLNFTTLGFTIEGESTGGAPTGYYMHTWAFFIVSLMSAILPLINIFLYKNLRLQKTLCLIEVLFLIAVAFIGALYGYNSIDNGAVSWSTLIIAPLLSLIADVMAYGRINSDQRKLRSADRLR